MSGVLQTFYCGNLKFEIACTGTYCMPRHDQEQPMGHYYTVIMYLTDQISIQSHNMVYLTDDPTNGDSPATMKRAINQFLDILIHKAHQKGAHWVDGALESKSVLDTLSNRLCSDVDHEFEASHPKWLISERPV
jgi:hypothetical protein